MIKTGFISWSSSGKLADSKLVSSTSLWVFFAPLVFKFLEVSYVDALGFFNFYNIFLLYLGGLSFFLASVVHVVFCPPFLKRFSSYSEYSDMGMGVENIDKYTSNLCNKASPLLMSIFEKNVDKALPSDIDNDEVYTVTIGQEPLNFTFKKKDLSVVFWCFYDYLDNEGFLSRLLCSMFYLFGFLSLLAVLVINFKTVIGFFLA